MSEAKDNNQTHPFSSPKYENLEDAFKRIYESVKPAKKYKQHTLEGYCPETKKERKTYPQDWAAYNQAQQKEKIILITLLNELLDSIDFPLVKRVGRKAIPTRDKIFYVVLQSYNVKSSRRCIADLELCRRLGFIQKTPHFNSVLKCLKDTSLMAYLKHLINVSGLPLQQVEMDFATDSTGFSTSQFDRWFDVRLGKENDKRRFKKAHATCGVKTNIITAVNITKGTSNDSPQFEPLVKETRKIYEIREMSADKAYSSRKNLNAVSQEGGIPFIPFKDIATGKPKGYSIWRKMHEFYTENNEEFLNHYHKRSNIETTFSMVKKKFTDYLRGKNEISQTNEILAKCMAHNLCVLIQESFELGIIINFEKCASIPIAHKPD